MQSKLKKTPNTKLQLANSIAVKEQTNPRDTLQIIQAFLNKITEALRDGKRLEFRDFGIFNVVQRKPKVGRNPKNPSIPIIIPARAAVKFTPGKKIESILKKLPLKPH